MNEVLTWLHGKNECWHGFDANKVLTWLHDKNECWHDFSANIGATSMRVQVLIWILSFSLSPYHLYKSQFFFLTMGQTSWSSSFGR